MNAEIPQTPKQIAHLLGWQGPGTYTSPSYDAVVIACQRGELKARQTGSRKSRWLILPSDAIAWRSGVKPQRLRRTA
ncbi:hypothetical protein [Rhodococcus sp. (in: high G+C Gram-positive bacteria)]|jgi:hypothetical protein|uniref:hypothetical protein n=1 Tax=Rhodococcus sp. TaxID=1831 RepID=UPI00195B7BD1